MFQPVRLIVLFFALFSFSYATWRIMPLGDSITYDYRFSDDYTPRPIGWRSSYRNDLWYMFEQAGVAVDFVGSQIVGDSVEPPFDPENEGHIGWTSYDVALHAYSIMTAYNPDIVLLHIGTNDTTASVEGVAQILDEIGRYERDSGHRVKVFVALIIDFQTPSPKVAAFNDMLAELLHRRIAEGDDIVIVDMYRKAGLTPDDYADFLHPNDTGYYKMALTWYEAIMANPYDTNTQQQPPNATDVPPQEYPLHLVAPEYIESESIVGKTVTFIVTVPDSGIVFK